MKNAAWATALLGAVRAPATPGNVRFVLRWMAAENGDGSWNPLGMNGTQDYPSFTAGLNATAGNLNTNPIYSPFVRGLRASTPTSAAALASLDRWNGNAGYGANVSRTPPVPAGGVIGSLSGKANAGGGGTTTTTAKQQRTADAVTGAAGIIGQSLGTGSPGWVKEILTWLELSALRVGLVLAGAGLVAFGLIWLLLNTKPAQAAIGA